ncbi:MAG TPA: alpha/beta hydrolase [Xanthomonadales bacterium]|nr:alpha/beta hydrolase [Xanthomonadales bacterium]
MDRKPVVYLLPGLLCDAAVWEHQAEALSALFEVRIPDFRGNTSFRQMAHQVLAEAPARFSVAGHSMGGRAAMELMHLAPERIDGFVVMDMGVHPASEAEKEKRQVLIDLLEREGMEALADAWIGPMLAPARRNDSTLIAAIRAMVMRFTPQEYRNYIQAALTRENQALYLPQIRHQVLLLCGAEDGWSPVEQHEEIQKQLRNAELVVIPKAGHMVTMEQPEAVSAVLLRWFADRHAISGP